MVAHMGYFFHYVNVNMPMNTCLRICNIWCFLRLQKRRFKVQIFMFSVNIGTYYALTIDCGYSLEPTEYSSIQSIVELRTAKMIIGQSANQYVFLFCPKRLLWVLIRTFSSWKHLRTKVTPDFHLTNSKNGENLGSK